MKHMFSSLRAKLLVMFIILASVPLLIVGIISFQKSYHTLSNHSKASTLLLADQLVTKIDTLFLDTQKLLELGSNPTVLYFLSSQTETYAEAKEIVQTLDTYRSTYQYDSVLNIQMINLYGKGISERKGVFQLDYNPLRNSHFVYLSEHPDEIVIGFSQLGSESDWRLANTTSIEEAAQEAGITLLLENAEQSQQAQFAAIRSFINKAVDVIVIAPVVQTGWESILLEVKEAGIPVVIIDRSVNVEDTSLYVTFIGSDFYEEGIKAGKYALDKMRNKPGTIQIVELEGTVGSTPSIDRGRGFRDAIVKREDMEIVMSKPADFTIEGGKHIMRQFLQWFANQPPQLLFAHNDDMALGAIEAIEEAGLKPGEDIVIISVDGTRQAFEMMLEGKINAVVECNPLQGALLMQAAREIMAGRTLPKRIIPQEDIFTQEYAQLELDNRKY